MPRAKEKKENISQRIRFLEAARELGCDGDKDTFEAKLKQIAKAKRAERKPKRHSRSRREENE